MSIAAPTSRARVLPPPGHRHDEILTPEALDFVGRLVDAFADRRLDLLKERMRVAARLASGSPLDFSIATARVRADDSWRVAPPHARSDRPPGRDHRTAGAPDGGQRPQLRCAGVDGGLRGRHRAHLGQHHRRSAEPARRHRAQDRLQHSGGQAVPARRAGRDHRRPPARLASDGGSPGDHRPSGARLLVDFGLYFFHCAQRQIDAGHGPYFYLPKLESRDEARLWNDVFILAQDLLGIPRGTIRATVLIETITAAVQMEEILYELREHSSGLNAGRWDYLFSLIKTFGHRTDFLLPDRAKVTMTAPFMRAYTELLVRTCHKRGAHAIGGMSAHVPGKDPDAHQAALATVRLDKEREAEDGFDGSWVAHPALVPVCREVFDGVLDTRPHQIDRTRNDVEVTAAHLLSVRRVSAPPTPEGVRINIAVALRYFAAWLNGQGAVALDGLMEDAATAEIARVQIWQWLRHRVVDRATVVELLEDELAALGAEYPWAPVDDVRGLFERTALTRELPAFFTLDAYTRHLAHRPEGQSPEGQS